MFFVLTKLFIMNEILTQQYSTIHLALKSLGFENYINESIVDNSIYNIEHLLGLVHKNVSFIPKNYT